MKARAVVTGLASALVVVCLPRTALPQAYEVNWSTWDGGGAQGTTSPAYELAGTAGQPDASDAVSGATYAVVGGFWAILGVPGGGQGADLSITKTNGTAASVPGTPVTYTVVASNAGPDPITGGTVSDNLPAALLGATWACVAAGGATCSASGSGSIDDTVDLPMGGTVTYTLSATVDPAATGVLANTASILVPPGTTDPNPGNNSATDTDTLTPQVDLSAAKTDGQSIAIPGGPITYTITIANAGPSDATGATVTDAVPATILGAAWTCTASPGASCAAAGSGSINDTVNLPAGGSLTYTLSGTVDPAATGTLVNTAAVAPPGGTADPSPGNNSSTDTDTLLLASIDGELTHGYQRQHDLAALPGPVPDEDLFRILQGRHASYEVVLDGASGDLGSGSGPLLDRVGPDASTLLQSSLPAGAGGSRSLRWMNALDTPVADEFVRVRSAGCTTTCDASDVYRLGARETTGYIPRFNNSGTQITVLVLENVGDQPIDVDVRFWSGAGASLGGPAVQTLGARQTYVLNTSSIVPLLSGSVTVANTGRYGQLAGKAVAVEPATGFTFDTDLVPRPR